MSAATRMATQVSSVTEAERKQYLSFELERRRRLLNVAVPAGLALTAIAAVVAGVTLAVAPSQDASVWINDGLTVLFAVLFGVGWLATRRGRLDVATATVVAAGGGGALATAVIACFSQGLSPLSFIQAGSLGIVVVIVGMLGGLRTIVGATIILNLATVFVFLFAPRTPALDTLIREQLPLLVSVALTYQWGVAAIMIAIWATYQRTLTLLGVAFARAQQLDTLKSQFITHINHELRTPIMTLQGYIEYLQMGWQMLPEAEVEGALKQAGRTADTLVTLLSNILDIRRIEGDSSFAPERVPVRAALDAALALIDPRVGQGSTRDLRLRLSGDPVVWGDRIRVQQILTNLLSNALKYSPPGSPVEVTAHVAEPASAPRRWRQAPGAGREMVEIVVRDYGLGIPPEQVPLLFNRFVRLPRDLASKVLGSGLGLYLCRVFAEAMGGTIRVESAGVPGEGSSFILRLPAPPADAPAPAPTSPDAS